jgi:hypothetical protein
MSLSTLGDVITSNFTPDIYIKIMFCTNVYVPLTKNECANKWPYISINLNCMSANQMLKKKSGMTLYTNSSIQSRRPSLKLSAWGLILNMI